MMHDGCARKMEVKKENRLEGREQWEGERVLIDVKSGGAPSPRPSPKGKDRLNRRRISGQRLYR
jgi:hypothetical protein